MKRIVLSFSLLLAVCFAGATAAFGYDAYEALLWIDANGTFLHATSDRDTALNSFIQYREVVKAGSKKKPGYFMCTHEGIPMQAPIKDIRSIKLWHKSGEIARKALPDKYNKLVLTMKDGREYKVEVERSMGYALANHDYIEFKYFNTITNKYEYGGIMGNKLREIRFE